MTKHIGAEFTKRTGQQKPYITERDWELQKLAKSKSKFPICRDCMKKSHYKFTIWWWSKSACSACHISGHDLYKTGKGLVIASINKGDK